MSVDRTVTDRQKRRLCVTLEVEILDALEVEAERRGTTASLLAGSLLRGHADGIARSAYCEPVEHNA